VTLTLTGTIIDLPANDLDASHAFWTSLIGRPADLSVRPTEREWRLLDRPGIFLRITAGAGQGSASLGVADLAAEQARLRAAGLTVPEISSRPGVIARLDLTDPAGNRVTLWESLLPKV
jgi:hypothetical protein